MQEKAEIEKEVVRRSIWGTVDGLTLKQDVRLDVRLLRGEDDHCWVWRPGSSERRVGDGKACSDLSRTAWCVATSYKRKRDKRRKDWGEIWRSFARPPFVTGRYRLPSERQTMDDVRCHWRIQQRKCLLLETLVTQNGKILRVQSGRGDGEGQNSTEILGLHMDLYKHTYIHPYKHIHVMASAIFLPIHGHMTYRWTKTTSWWNEGEFDSKTKQNKNTHTRNLKKNKKETQHLAVEAVSDIGHKTVSATS